MQRIRFPRALAPVTALITACGFSAVVQAQNAGPQAFNNHCRTCHSVKADDNRVGPSLHNVFGKKAAEGTGYAAYSQGLKSSGITWDEANLDKFIENPDAVVPNNNMKPYKGITDAAVRKEIVAYLKSLSKPS
jgi:cytochrome c